MTGTAGRQRVLNHHGRYAAVRALALSVWAAGCCGCFRQPSVPATAEQAAAAPTDPGCFEEVGGQLGLRFQHSAAGADRYFFPALMAGGAALQDLDADGDLDVLLLNSARLAADSGPPDPAAERAAHGLFLQQADGSFVNRIAESGLDVPLYAVGVTAGDITNDGLPDLYITAHGADRLFVNRGHGQFQDVTASSGIRNDRWGTSAALLDFDRDGWLDVFVANYVEYDPGRPCNDNAGRQDFCNPNVFPRTSDRLFRNITGESSEIGDMPGGPRFQDVSAAAGIASVQGAGLGVVTADVNRDGWMDIFVANDGHANFLWINQQNGTFVEEGVLRGVSYDAAGQGQGSMGVASGDLNHDGLIDLLVTNLDGESNALYLSRHDSFTEESAAAQLADPSFPLTGFGTAFVDIENDGDLDLAVVNGRVRRQGRTGLAVPAISGGSPVGAGEFWRPYAELASLLRNDSAGQFQPVPPTQDALAAFSGVARGLATGDIDNDGDVDLLVTALDQPVRLFRNRGRDAGHWLLVRVLDPTVGDRDAVGAEVTVIVGGAGLRRWLSGGGSYLCASDPRLHFGLGTAQQIEAIEVVWPDGVRELFPGGGVDQLRVLQRGQGTLP